MLTDATNLDFYNTSKMLNRQAELAEYRVEDCCRMGVGTGSIAALRELRKEADRKKELARMFQDVYSDRIEEYLEAQCEVDREEREFDAFGDRDLCR